MEKIKGDQVYNGYIQQTYPGYKEITVAGHILNSLEKLEEAKKNGEKALIVFQGRYVVLSTGDLDKACQEITGKTMEELRTERKDRTEELRKAEEERAKIGFEKIKGDQAYNGYIQQTYPGYKEITVAGHILNSLEKLEEAKKNGEKALIVFQGRYVVLSTGDLDKACQEITGKTMEELRNERDGRNTNLDKEEEKSIVEPQVGGPDIAKLAKEKEITSKELAPVKEKGIKAFIRKMINKIKGIGE